MTTKVKFVKRLNKIMMVSLIALMMPIGHALAQAPGGDDDLEDPDPQDVPIDGGLSILLAAGASYGARKMYLKKKKQQDETAN